MADYTQPDYIEKRLRYFDGQFLKDQDFIDEQKYHIDRQRRYGRFLNVSGIIDGLAVKAGTSLVTVDPGTALDSKGRQLVLGSQATIALKGFEGTTVDLVITYNEESTDQAQAGSAGFSRFHEIPQLTLVKSGDKPPEGAISLARLQIDNSGTVQINSTVRMYAGLRLPYDGAAPGTGLLLRAGSADRVDLTGSLNVSGNANVGGTLSVTGASTFTGSMGIGTVAQSQKLAVSSSTEHLQLRREATETVGGTQLFLELYQDDPQNKVPEVWPNIRFHHNSNFWQRIEGRGDGFHFKKGDIPSDDYVPLTVGVLNSRGKITSPMWRIETLLRVSGPLPTRESTFTTNGGTFAVLFSGTAYCPPSGGYTAVNLRIDNMVRVIERSSNDGGHHALPTTIEVYTGINAGQHTIKIEAKQRTATAADGNDYFYATLMEFPF